jgi:hypothetical protein
MMDYVKDDHLLVSHKGSNLSLYDLETEKCTMTVSAHVNGSIKAIALLDHNRIVTGDATGLIKVWNLGSFRCEYAFRINNIDKPVLCLTVLPPTHVSDSSSYPSSTPSVDAVMAAPAAPAIMVAAAHAELHAAAHGAAPPGSILAATVASAAAHDQSIAADIHTDLTRLLVGYHDHPVVLHIPEHFKARILYSSSASTTSIIVLRDHVICAAKLGIFAYNRDTLRILYIMNGTGTPGNTYTTLLPLPPNPVLFAGMNFYGCVTIFDVAANQVLRSIEAVPTRFNAVNGSLAVATTMCQMDQGRILAVAAGSCVTLLEFPKYPDIEPDTTPSDTSESTPGVRQRRRTRMSTITDPSDRRVVELIPFTDTILGMVSASNDNHFILTKYDVLTGAEVVVSDPRMGKRNASHAVKITI